MPMLLAVCYRWNSTVTYEDRQRVRQLFMAWTAPPGIEIVNHYHFARGGGIILTEVTSVSVIYEGLVPFMSSLDFEIEPVLDIVEAIAISMDVHEWANTVSTPS